MDGVPGWLACLPEGSAIRPGIEGHSQPLPLNQLSPRDFERLCYHAIRREAEVEQCGLYGVGGQQQDGIDLYARRRDDTKYTVYQCKRVEAFGRADIKEAFARFKNGKWFQRASSFVLCVSIDLDRTEQIEQLEKEALDLRLGGKEFVWWTKTSITDFLRPEPELVDLFFGRQWVRLCCGIEAAQNLGGRLDNDQILRLRDRLRAFYARHAQRYGHDMVSTGTDREPLHVQERFVLPDVLLQERTRPPSQPINGGRSYVTADSDHLPQSLITEINRPTEVRASLPVQHRLSMDVWASKSDRLIVLGEPGAGKSTLLRFIAQDLLSPEPKLVEITRRWGLRLPVILPFAHWAARSAREPTASLKTVIESWLSAFDPTLWSLVSSGLDHDQLVLLVDGLDEWTNEHGAKMAVEKLLISSDLSETPLLLTSRPLGFAALDFPTAGWQSAELAPFNHDQQEELVHKCFAYWHDRDVSPVAVVDELAADFLRELRDAPQLAQLAANPLLLTLLLIRRGDLAYLPTDRLAAYRILLDHLIEHHNAARRRAALVNPPDDGMSVSDVRFAMSRLAYAIQTDYSDGSMPLAGAQAILRDHFVAEDGLTPRHALELADQVLSDVTQSVGVLVERAPGSVGFVHRFVQETLAADWLSSRPTVEQAATLATHGLEQAWHDVVLLLLQTIRRPSEIAGLLEALSRAVNWDGDRFAIEAIRTQIACGAFACPPELSREIVSQTIDRIESYGWLPHRRRLLQHLFGGLATTRLHETAHERFRHWFPSRWRPGLLLAMGEWPEDSHVADKLLAGLYDEEERNQRDAVAGLAKAASRSSSLADRLTAEGRRSQDEKARAGALHALALSVPHHPEVPHLIALAEGSSSAILRVAAIHLKVKLGQQSSEDLQALIDLSRDGSGFSFYGRDDLMDLPVEGWKGNQTLKRAALRSLRETQRHPDHVESAVAEYWAMAGFEQDDDVAAWIVDQLQNERFPFLMLNLTGWQLLATNFKLHRLIVGPLTDWIKRVEHQDVEVALAAMLAANNEAKEAVLSGVLTSSFPHWSAQSLLDTWGMEDADVSGTLTKIVATDDQRAANIGFLIPRIIPDPDEAFNRMIRLLRTPSTRPDFLLRALRDIAKPEQLSAVVDAALVNIGQWHPLHRNGYAELIQLAPADQRVRKLALEQFNHRQGAIWAVARMYADDPELRTRVLEASAPLPALLRLDIVTHLRAHASRDQRAMELLALSRYDQNPEVLTAGTISNASALIAAGRDTQIEAQRLQRELSVGGMDLDARRQAALAGLVTLDRLDLVTSTAEHEPTGRRVAITSFLHSNSPLLHALGRHWERLQLRLGDRLVSLLARTPNDQRDPWIELSNVAAEYPALRADLLRKIAEDPSLLSEASVLDFLSSVSPGSINLREACVDALRSRSSPSHVSRGSPPAYMAAEILGTQFADETEIIERIRPDPPMPFYFDSAFVLALCEGWPDRVELRQAFEALRTERASIDWNLYLALIARIGPSNDLAPRLRDIVTRGNEFRYADLQIGLRLVLRRLSTDSLAADDLFEALKIAQGSSERISFLKLLANSRMQSNPFREWLLNEYQHQVEQDGPDVGYDILDNTATSLSIAILDVVASSGR